MKDLIEYLVTNVIGTSEGVSIKSSETPETINISISVPAPLVGRVIGKNGKTINAIRSLAKVIAIKSQKKLLLNLSDSPLAAG